MIYAAGLTACLLAASATPVDAGLIDIHDLNTTARFDTSSQGGLFEWTVNDVNQLARQWFWYRVGDDAPERSVDSLTLAAEHSVDTNPFTDPARDQLSLVYQEPRFQIELGFTLRGSPAPGGDQADMAEQIRITSRSNETLDFHFYQYVDFDLQQTAADGGVNFPSFNTVRQWDGKLVVSETVVTPPPSSHEAAAFSVTLDALNDAGPTNLNNVDFAGPGNVTWAFHWNFDLGPNRSFLISKDKRLVVPEPQVLLFLTVGTIGIIARRRPGDR